ncbi:uncharacterized protein VTP21DRAFT_3342 [Calcarisporiella thermophila]|uniref:uncharacterized protein n=1 Tax=Calcarisporiella thermophila TaxID=911321 RepID=UPI003743FD6F
MPLPIERFYYDIPPITRAWVTGAVVISLLEHLQIINKYQLYYRYHLVFEQYEVWRLITTFLFFGKFSIDFVFHMFFLVRHSGMLEEESFRHRRADFLYLIFFASSLLLLIAPIARLDHLAAPLSSTLVYIWARRNPFIRMSFLGLFIFTAPYLPWVLVSFSVLFQHEFPKGELAGIAIGHIYYFLEDVWPRDPASGGKRWLETPVLVKRLFGEARLPDDAELDEDDNEDGAENEQENGSEGPQHTSLQNGGHGQTGERTTDASEETESTLHQRRTFQNENQS